MRKFDLSLRSSRSSYFATFRHQLTILSKTDALDEEKWLNMLGTFVKDWFRYESHFRSEERRVGKECRTRWRWNHLNKKSQSIPGQLELLHLCRKPRQPVPFSPQA